MELRIFAGPGPRFPSVPVELLGFVIDTLGSLLLWYNLREGQYRGLLFEECHRYDQTFSLNKLSSPEIGTL